SAVSIDTTALMHSSTRGLVIDSAPSKFSSRQRETTPPTRRERFFVLERNEAGWPQIHPALAPACFSFVLRFVSSSFVLLPAVAVPASSVSRLLLGLPIARAARLSGDRSVDRHIPISPRSCYNESDSPAAFRRSVLSIMKPGANQMPDQAIK